MRIVFISMLFWRYHYLLSLDFIHAYLYKLELRARFSPLSIVRCASIHGLYISLNKCTFLWFSHGVYVCIYLDVLFGLSFSLYVYVWSTCCALRPHNLFKTTMKPNERERARERKKMRQKEHELTKCDKKMNIDGKIKLLQNTFLNQFNTLTTRLRDKFCEAKEIVRKRERMYGKLDFKPQSNPKMTAFHSNLSCFSFFFLFIFNFHFVSQTFSTSTFILHIQIFFLIHQ